MLIEVLEYIGWKYRDEVEDMLELVIYGIGLFLCTLLIQYLLYKIRKNHNHGTNSIWVGNRAIIVWCVVEIMNHNVGYLAAILDLSVRMRLGRRWDGIEE